MGLPLYKYLEVIDAKQASVWAKLANAMIGSQPVVVDISKLADKERQALELVEEFIRLKKAWPFPYPLYIVSNLKNHLGVIDIFPTRESLPKHFKQKNRPLNMKENTLMAKVVLKQNKLSNINIEEFKPVAASYAAKHKIIHKKQSYLDYLDEILKGLRGKK